MSLLYYIELSKNILILLVLNFATIASDLNHSYK